MRGARAPTSSCSTGARAGIRDGPHRRQHAHARPGTDARPLPGARHRARCSAASAGRELELRALLARASCAEGEVRVAGRQGEVLLCSSERACPCGRGVPELDPRCFSFNTRQGACEACEGKGVLVATNGRGKKAHEERSRAERARAAPRPSSRAASRSTARRYHAVCWRRASTRRSRARRRRRSCRDATRTIARRAARESSSCASSSSSGWASAISALDRAARHPDRRRDAARAPGRAARQRPHRRALRARRAHHRPAPARHRAAARAPRGRWSHRATRVLVVEHDAETIRAADHVDRPRARRRHARRAHRGAQGTPERAARATRARSPARAARPPGARSSPRALDGATLARAQRRAREHNLQAASTLAHPAGRASCAVTGVSGSGKSTLVRKVLLPGACATRSGS